MRLFAFRRWRVLLDVEIPLRTSHDLGTHQSPRHKGFRLSFHLLVKMRQSPEDES